MREYGQIQCGWWNSDALHDATDLGRLLGAYLLTGPHSNGIGCYRLPNGYITEDLKWPEEKVDEGFNELSRNGFAYRCGTVVFIPNFLRWNPVSNPNVAAARMTEFRALPRGPAKALCAEEMLRWCKHLGDDQRAELKEITTVTETVTETVGETVWQTRSDPIRSDPIPPEPTRTETGTSAAPTSKRRGASRETDPDWWLDFKLAYPERSGDPNWRGGLRAAHARLAEGHTEAEMLAGAKRYAAFVEVTGKTGTEFVKQASTFLGPGKAFLLPWTAPPKTETDTERLLRMNSRPTDDGRTIEHDAH